MDAILGQRTFLVVQCFVRRALDQGQQKEAGQDEQEARKDGGLVRARHRGQTTVPGRQLVDDVWMNARVMSAGGYTILFMLHT